MNNKKLFLMMLACLILAMPAAKADERIAYVVVDAGSVLNVRMNPSLGADVLFVMERGECLTVDSLGRDGWAQVSRAGDFGYCRIDYLSDTPPMEPERYLTTASKLRVRKLPNGDSVRKLSKGAQVLVTGWLTDEDGVTWAKVNGGYIDADYLTPDDENNTVATGAKRNHPNHAAGVDCLFHVPSLERSASCKTCEKLTPSASAAALSHAGRVTVRLMERFSCAMRTAGMNTSSRATT